MTVPESDIDFGKDLVNWVKITEFKNSLVMLILARIQLLTPVPAHHRDSQGRALSSLYSSRWQYSAVRSVGGAAPSLLPRPLLLLLLLLETSSLQLPSKSAYQTHCMGGGKTKIHPFPVPHPLKIGPYT